MKVPEIRDLPSEEIETKLQETRRELFNLRFRRETENLEKPDQLRKAKRMIARLLTILRERELEAQEKQAAPPAAQA
jgi:large subunit ribosomal protein L29